MPGRYPTPTPEDLDETARLLSSIAEPVLIDGLAYGAFPDPLIDLLQQPPIALCHHPLGMETGLDAYQAAILIRDEARALARAAHIIVTSPETKRTLVADMGQDEARITVAPPGLDKVEPRDDLRGGVPTILTVASLTPRKGHDTLIAALAQLKDQAWEAVWVGPLDRDPPHTELLKLKIAEAGLAHRIRLTGPQSAEDLEDSYAAADIFCLPSRYEGYGMVFAEAMMRALPIVACNTGAVAELVPPRAGLLTPADDPDALAEALSDLLSDAPIRAAMGAAGRAEALAIGDWDATWAIAKTVLTA
ncbi:MAG: glycosyltransferase family 4 protein [Pseudomonadota bacterium]